MELIDSSVFFSDKPHSLTQTSPLSGGVWRPQFPLYWGLLDALWAQHSKSVPRDTELGTLLGLKGISCSGRAGSSFSPNGHQTLLWVPFTPMSSLWVVWLPSSTAWKSGGMGTAFGDEGPQGWSPSVTLLAKETGMLALDTS